MPYVVKAGEKSTAVATLGAAKERAHLVCQTALDNTFVPARLVLGIEALPESGGTVTLPDGTVIEVEPRKWYRLAQDVGWHPDRDEHRGEDELIAVWNAKQASA
jgi:hypothetical protein